MEDFKTTAKCVCCAGATPRRGLAYLVPGLGLGFLLGVLFAPRSGGDTRRFISDAAGDGVERLKATADQGAAYIKNRVTNLKEAVSSAGSRAGTMLDQAEEAVIRKTDQVSQAVKAV